MPLTKAPFEVRTIETLLLKEMDHNGRILVRGLDRVHARTGLNYTTISEMAQRLEEQARQHLTA